MQEAFTIALEQWPVRGIPVNPRAWLVSTAQHKGVDLLRRSARFDSKRDELQRIAELEQTLAGADDSMSHQPEIESFGDDRLRLIFTCCHPALVLEAQVALTLRTLCGLSTDEIARGFLVPLPTMAQRLVRAKQKIRSAHIPYQVPPAQELPERIEAVLLVVYLVFNEGYSATSGDTVIRRELCAEAIRLGRILCQLLPDQAEARALLALMLLHDSRRDARSGENGEPILLEDQVVIAGTTNRSAKAWPWWSRLFAKDRRAHMLCKRQSPPCTLAHGRRAIPTGARSLRYTNCFCGCSRRPSSS